MVLSEVLFLPLIIYPLLSLTFPLVAELGLKDAKDLSLNFMSLGQQVILCAPSSTPNWSVALILKCQKGLLDLELNVLTKNHTLLV